MRLFLLLPLTLALCTPPLSPISNLACVILVDAAGTVRWLRNGMFDDAAYKMLAARTSSLLTKP